LSFMTMVRASVAVSESTGASGLTELTTLTRAPLPFTKRFQVCMMSSISRARPLTGALLCHLALARVFIVIVRPSGATSHDSAKSGLISSDAGACKIGALRRTIVL